MRGVGLTPCHTPSHDITQQLATVFTKPREFLLEEDEVQADQRKRYTSPVCVVNVEDCINILALIDTGSEVSCISETIFNQLIAKNKNIVTLPVVGVTILGATNKRSKRINKQVLLSIEIGAIHTEVVCLVVPELICELILGVDWLCQNGVDINFKAGTMNVGGTDVLPELLKIDKITTENVPLEIRKITVEIADEKREVDLLNVFNISKHESNEKLITEVEIDEMLAQQSELSKVQGMQLKSLLMRYRHIFSNRPGLIKGYEHDIKVKDQTYIFEKNYPIPFSHRAAVNKQIQQMLDWGIIERAASPYISPLVVVAKKDNTVRVCLDARALNKNLIPERESPNTPEEILQSLSDVRWLSNLDMVSSFYQVALSKNSRKYVSFKYNGAVYSFCVLPFGLSTSVSAFFRAMHHVLGDDLEEFCKLYVDDLLVNSRTFEEHLRHLEIIFIRLSRARMTVNFFKSRFTRSTIPFLGHVLTREGVYPDPLKLTQIQNWPSPRSPRQLKAFLGLCSFFRRFSNVYAQSTVLLQTLLKKDSKWIWDNQMELAFQNVKSLFIETVHLRFPDYNKTFYLQCDASDKGLGGLLFQVDEDGNQQVISMASRLIRGNEVAYTVCEKELLAVVFSLMKFRIFILGVNDLVILTDHKALTFLMQCRLLSGRLTRWILFIQEFRFKIQHCAGKENVIADILSRFPTKHEEDIVEESKSQRDVIIATNVLKPIDIELRRKLVRLAEYQKNDLRLGTIWQAIEAKTGDKLMENYSIFQGRLFFKPKRNGSYKLCVPTELIKDIIMSVHKELGHFGANKCFVVLNENFYYKNLSRLVRQVISACDLCQRTKQPNKISHGTFQPIIADNLGLLVSTDIFGPLPVGAQGYRYVLVFVDVFSKLVSLYPLVRQTSTAVSKKTKLYFQTVQKPVAILSDNGTQFKSREYRDMLEGLGVRLYMSSIRHPQSNPVERVMKELGRLFRAYCSTNHAGWVKWVTQLEEWLNSTYHESTGFSPYELHFNQTFSERIAKMFKVPRADGIAMPHNAKIVLAQDRLRTKGERRRDRHEENFRVKTVFQIGDRVLLRSVHISSLIAKESKKFFHIYEGPYVVSAIAGDNAYTLSTYLGVKKGNFNVINLKKYKTL